VIGDLGAATVQARGTACGFLGVLVMLRPGEGVLELAALVALLGASIIVASTLYVARREQLLNRQTQAGGSSALG
jgi:drug/metabolite transporter (DMT)-like permease